MMYQAFSSGDESSSGEAALEIVSKADSSSLLSSLFSFLFYLLLYLLPPRHLNERFGGYLIINIFSDMRFIRGDGRVKI